MLHGEVCMKLATTLRIDRAYSPTYHQSIRHEGDVRNAEGAHQPHAVFTLFTVIGIVEIVVLI